jgi:hypothetical protein
MEQDRTIRLCGLKFKRQCPLNWDALKPTAEGRSRYCGTCDRSVFLCESDEETMWHAEQGHCIARPVPKASDVPEVVLGEPDAEWLRGNQPTGQQEEARRLSQRERNINGALDNLQFSKKRCAACGYPVPSWWEACRVCGSTELGGPASVK